MEWTLEKIKSYILFGTEESLRLEYKRLDALTNSDKNKSELAKDISAFANSAGGDIIYGVVEKNHKPVEIDVSNSEARKEWIENIINSNVQPKIDNIKIYPIDNTEHGNQLFVISVPQSDKAPHMANFKYHKRYNFKSAAMEHYEIEDIRNRKNCPDLALSLPDVKNKSEKLNFFSVTLQAFITNYSNSLVEYYSVNIFYPKSWKISLNDNSLRDCGESQVVIEGEATLFNMLAKSFYAPHFPPLWKNTRSDLLGKSLQIDIPMLDTNPLIIKLSCPNAQDKDFFFYPQQQQDTVFWHSKNILGT